MEIRMQKGFVNIRGKKGSVTKTVLNGIITVLIASCTLFGEIMPFGIALYAAQYLSAPPYFLGTLVLLSALFPLRSGTVLIKYTITLLLFSVIASKKGKAVTKTPLSRGILMSFCVFISGLFMLLDDRILIYDCFILFLEAAITLAFVCLFANARETLTKDVRFSSPQDALSVSALVGAVILGISGFFSLCGLYVTIPLSALAVLLLTHESGLTSGAVAGITIGLLATIECGRSVLGIFAAAGLAAGYFSQYGRGGGVLAFLCTAAGVSFYTDGSSTAFFRLYEIAAPALIYLALPQGLLHRLSPSAGNENKQNRRAARLLAEDLGEKAAAFTCLSETFTEISKSRLQNSNIAAANFFEKTARKTCDGCKKLSFCWKKEFHRTYAAFFVMLEICSREGHVGQNDIPISLYEKCIRHTALIEAFNSQYQVYLTDKLWEGRMQECRALVSRQLSSVAHILSTMERNMKSGIAENCAMENLLRARLSEEGFIVRDASVTEKKRGFPTVHLQTAAAPRDIMPIAAEVFGMPMELLSARGDKITLSPMRRIVLSVSGETLPKNESTKSGDHFDSVYLENGCYLLLLSDGMGSGEKAALHSRAAVTLLKALFSAGFDADTAIGLVNSVLVLKSSEDTFATLDLLLLNTHASTVEFIKAGAAASFIKRGKNVKVFAGGSLPAGILPSPSPVYLSDSILPGDMIIMLSDGVQDPARKTADGAWIAEFLRNADTDDPRVLAHRLLQCAREKCDGKICDDMTVICAAVRENGHFVA